MTSISKNQQHSNTLNVLAKSYLTFLPIVGMTLNLAWSPVALSQDESCPTTGLIKQDCYAAKTTLNQVTVLRRVGISGANLQGNIQNWGWISNSTVASGATVTGGVLSGYILNQGTISDIEFRGAELRGGTLAGSIINNSRVRGVLIDVNLAANTYVRGGEMQGRIKGDPKAPALLENVRIRSGSQLSGVTIGQNVTIESGVTMEEDVIDNKRDDLPELGIAVATNAQGEALTVNAYFWGGSKVADEPFKPYLKKKLTDRVKISGSITVAPEHVGQTAEIIVYAAFKPATFPVTIRFMLDSKGKTVGWKGDMAKLEAFQEDISLKEIQSVEIYEGLLNKFVDASGTAEVYFGYRLGDGTVVTNSTPIKIAAIK
jgi:hypothetical protein